MGFLTKKRWQRRHLVEAFMKFLMRVSLAIVAGTLGLILFIILVRGLPALSWDMVTKIPEGGYYMGKGGGILNAIIGSLYLAIGGTIPGNDFQCADLRSISILIWEIQSGVSMYAFHWMCFGASRPLSMELSHSR